MEIFNGIPGSHPAQELFREIRIPVPWGHIAGKAYGKKDGHPVLALHGWQDNLGTFDLLIPQLSPELHIVTIDFPGHGLSSHRPPGTLYHVFDYIIDIHRVVEHLHWREFSFIGHSLGAAAALAYSGCFPERVLKVVSLDQVTAIIYPVENLPKRMAIGIGQLLHSELIAAKNPRSVSLDVAKKVLMASMEGCFTEDAARIQLKRGTAPADKSEKVVFTRDRALLVNPIPGITADQVKAIARNVSCKILLIVASRGYAFTSATKEDIDDLLSIYKKTAKSFRMVRVDGTHHVHLNNPKLVVPHVNEFLQF